MNGYSLIWYLAIIVLVPTCVPAMEKEQSVLGKRAAIELYSGSQETDLLDLDEQRMAKTPRLEAEKELLTLQLISIPTLLITEFDQITPVSTPALRNSEGLFPLPTDGRYKCDYEGCNFATKHNSTLKTHKLSHTGEKPFKCDYGECNFTTTGKGTLKTHKLIHADEKLYQCNYCNFATKHRISLNRHMKTQHLGQDIISIPMPIVASVNQMTPATPLASVFEKIEREINMEEL